MPEKAPSGYFIVRVAVLSQTFSPFLLPRSKYCVHGDVSGSGSAQNLVRDVRIRSFLGFLPCHKMNRSYGKSRTETRDKKSWRDTVIFCHCQGLWQRRQRKPHRACAGGSSFRLPSSEHLPALPGRTGTPPRRPRRATAAPPQALLLRHSKIVAVVRGLERAFFCDFRAGHV